MTIQQYITNINSRYQQGNATEHTFRGDLQQLIESIVPTVVATNEPKRQQCGAPDYILTKKDITVGFIEAKDIGDTDLAGIKKTGNKEQFDRYKASLGNIIFTDYLDFHLYRDGVFVISIKIGELQFPSLGGVRGGSSSSGGAGVVSLPNNHLPFTNLLKDFCTHISQTIKSPKRLAEMMAGKARLLSDVIENALNDDVETQENSTLKEQMNAFKQILIHDITPKAFADVYAQTIAYGMFAARLHDPTLPTFSRQEAAELIPKTNPFLRKLFGYIAGPDIDDRIKWIVDSLVEIFLACNVEEILKGYAKKFSSRGGDKEVGEDPIIHFYETFLSEYDPKLRKARGVWYTPAPVVNFIVRAVDDVLKTEFGLSKGLADTSKTKIKVKVVNKATADQRSKMKESEIEEEVHRVQILDPATGTGTFLAEVVKHIHKKFAGQQGIWSNYVQEHLLPRLNGFELLMASYAMAHLQLDLLLTETGYKTTPSPSKGGEQFPSFGGVVADRGGSQRLRIYLTNSLEESHPDTGTLFANWLSSEANEANRIKRDAPVMCVIGNPPYAVSSTNKNEWIENLTSDYKKNLNERSYNSLSDDYVKFIRYGQYFIDKNRSGVLAYISNNSFIDGLVFRQMRKHLLESFDSIYILDLHGNAKKKEVCADGSADQNVFDIMQGVSINIFIKTGKKKKGELGEVKHFDLQGKRDDKYDFLNSHSLINIEWEKLKFKSPNYFFVKKNFNGVDDYENFFAINDLFNEKAAGIKTHRDAVVIGFDKNEVEKQVKTYWDSIKVTEQEFKQKRCKEITYRPFDNRIIYYDKDLVVRHRKEQMKHSLSNNYSLLTGRQTKSNEISHFFITDTLSEMKTAESTTGSYHFQLYLYPEKTEQLSLGQAAGNKDLEGFQNLQGLARVPNLNMTIVDKIAKDLGLQFVAEKFPSQGGVPAGRGGEFPLPAGRGGRNTQNYMSLPYNPKLKEKAKALRKAGNLSEVLFWNQVKNKQFKDFDFDRQKIIGNYIVDFYCTNCNVVIEIDGSSHDNKQEYDAERDNFLKNLGLTVIHIAVVDIMKNMNEVMKMLYNHPALKGTPPQEGNFAPIDILDYIYAVLHSPSYREKYKEFLKIDFPRVPYPKDLTTFQTLSNLGSQLRQIHLLESDVVENYITEYPVSGNNMVEKIVATPSPSKGGEYVDVYINYNKDAHPLEVGGLQYFANVPLVAWQFYIGGYQPAQKWLKDRKGRALGFEDILHYQKIIVALTETDKLMNEIDIIEL